MRIAKIVLAVVLFLVSFFCIIMSIAFFADKELGSGIGIFFIVIAGITLLIGINAIKTRNIKKTEPKPASDRQVFIAYEDNKGNFSDRLIEINRLYKKGGETYIDAYCFLSDGDRTFKLDRILNMRDGNEKGPIIKLEDMENYLTGLFKNPAYESAESLAEEAAKNDDSGEKKKPDVSTVPIDPTVELKKYKELLDTGVITQDDFDAKKKQLLNL